MSHKSFAIDLGEDVSTGLKPNGILVFSFDTSDKEAVRRVLIALDTAKQNVVLSSNRQERRGK